MEFEVFKNTIRGFVNAEMPGTSMYEKRICKANEDYLGLVVEIGRINPILNLDELFTEYQNGKEISEICNSLISSLNFKPEVNTYKFFDYESAKSRLFIKLVGVSENSDYLSDKVHRNQFETISIVPCAMFYENENGIVSAPVTKAVAESWGIPEDQIIDDAIQNAPNVIPCEMKSLFEKLFEMMPGLNLRPSAIHILPGHPAECDTYFAGADHFGAACIFYPGFLENAADKLECNFFIIPSSIHEVLFVKDIRGVSADEYYETVTSINETEVSPADKLCDAVFYYDSHLDRLVKIK